MREGCFMLIQTAMTVGETASQRPDDLGCPGLVGATIRYAHDQEIHGEAENAKFIFKVISGAVRRHKVLSDGRRQIGSFHLPGDVFGFESGPTYRLTAEAIVDTVLVTFNRRTVNRFARRDLRTARRLWKLTVHELDHAADRMLLLGRKTALERVSDFLLEMNARLRGTTLPMCRRDIADYLGLTIETVSRTLTRLKEDGVVDVASRRIEVLTPFFIDEMQNVIPMMVRHYQEQGD
jgi:CRP/FNR family nitrogen fixation transcriptional regulator